MKNKMGQQLCQPDRVKQYVDEYLMVRDRQNIMHIVFYFPFKDFAPYFRPLSVWQDKLCVPQAHSNKFFIVTGSAFFVK